MEHWKETLIDYGWCAVQRSEQLCSIAKIVNYLEPKRTKCQKLRSQIAEKSRRNTLSSNHGVGEFPLHTDCATDATPPRYILLAASKNRKANTLIFDPKKIGGQRMVCRCVKSSL